MNESLYEMELEKAKRHLIDENKTRFRYTLGTVPKNKTSLSRDHVNRWPEDKNNILHQTSDGQKTCASHSSESLCAFVLRWVDLL